MSSIEALVIVGICVLITISIAAFAMAASFKR